MEQDRQGKPHRFVVKFLNNELAHIEIPHLISSFTKAGIGGIFCRVRL
jgi:hypothetical protein